MFPDRPFAARRQGKATPPVWTTVLEAQRCVRRFRPETLARPDTFAAFTAGRFAGQQMVRDVRLPQYPGAHASQPIR